MAFFSFYNNGLALSYPKMQFWGRNWTKTWFDAYPVGGNFDFMSLRQLVQVNWKHKSIPFSVLCNNGLTLQYGKTSSWVRKWRKSTLTAAILDFLNMADVCHIFSNSTWCRFLAHSVHYTFQSVNSGPLAMYTGVYGRFWIILNELEFCQKNKNNCSLV